MPDRFLLVRVPGWVVEEFDVVLDVAESHGFGPCSRSEAIAAVMHLTSSTNDWGDAQADPHVDDSFVGGPMRSYRLDRLEREAARDA